MSEVTILLVGHTDRSEFRRARATLDELGQVTVAAGIEEAAALLAQGTFTPHVIVMAQTFPGQFSREAIDRLRQLAPLARVLGLMGSWCEGEMRTGEPWPAVIRIYWHQWRPRCGQELARLLRGEFSAWGLPITATDEERLLVEAEAPRAPRHGLIAIHAGPFEMADWLSAACCSRGYATVWLRASAGVGRIGSPSCELAGVNGITAAIFDGAELRGDELDELARLADALRPAPVIALLGFPRIDDVGRATAAGAAAVVSKPLHLGDLFWQLDHSISSFAALDSPRTRSLYIG